MHLVENLRYFKTVKQCLIDLPSSFVSISHEGDAAREAFPISEVGETAREPNPESWEPWLQEIPDSDALSSPS